MHNKTSGPLSTDPVWPLPRRSDKLSEAEIRMKAQKYKFWNYAYEFEGGLSLATEVNGWRGGRAPQIPLKRFRHMMPWLLAANGGDLSGKRVLDIACNSGFWSFQCALLGAREVVGFDARTDLIEQAGFIKKITGIENVHFKTLDFWEMASERLGGIFDIVLNLGILYHLPKPLHALELTQAIARKHILLDTALIPSTETILRLRWEKPSNIRMAATEGITVTPSQRSLEMMFEHIEFSEWTKIPVRLPDIHSGYLAGRRSAWLLTV